MKKNKQAAFTLVELLVVAAIVGILAALLMTSLTRAKRRAQQTQCANNVRQLGLAIQEFRTANHTYPPTYKDGEGAWVAFVEREMNGHQQSLDAGQVFHKGVWLCPSTYRPASLPSNRDFCFSNSSFVNRPLSRRDPSFSSSSATSRGLWVGRIGSITGLAGFWRDI